MSGSRDEFVRENRTHVLTLSNGLVELEDAPEDAETLEETFRAAHTLKGNLDMAGYGGGRALAHAVEDLLDGLRTGSLTPDADLIDAALAATDDIESIIVDPSDEAPGFREASERAQRLRDRLADARSRAGSDADDTTGPDGSTTAPISDRDATTNGSASAEASGLDFDAMESDPDADMSVDEALASVSELDDLDALVEDMDDTEAGLPELDDGGVFFDDRAESGDDGSPDEASSDPVEDDAWVPAQEDEPAEANAADGPTDTGRVNNDGWDEFEALRSEREPDATDIETLQAELEAVEFGEFDDEDTMSISDLAESVRTTPDTTAAADPEGDAANAAPSEEPPAAPVDADAETPTPADGPASGDRPASDPEPTRSEAVFDNEPSALDASADGIDVDGTAVESPSSAEALAGTESAADVEAFEERFADVFEGADAGASARTVRASEQVVATLDREAFADPDDLVAERTATTPVVTPIDSLTVDLDNADELLDLVEDLSLVRTRLAGVEGADETLRDATAMLDRTLSDLRETVFDIRLMPFSTVTTSLPRVVRDAAAETDKEVDLTVSGSSVTLDRGVISRLRDPLVHLVRNAVAHGVEPPEERAAADKDPTGSVEVRATRSADQATIEVIDDGRGIDADAVRERAVEAGIVDEATAAELSDPAARELVFEPGFSTAEEVTELSGRGVGMNAVKEVIDDLSGTLEIESDPGLGTVVRLQIPITAAMVPVVFVLADGEEYAVPVSAIDHVSRVDVESTTEKLPTVRAAAPAAMDGTATDDGTGPDAATERERIDLAEAMAGPADGPGERSGGPVAIRIRRDIRPVTLICDAVRGIEDAVVHPFAGAITDRTGLSGSVLRNESLTHILDPEAL